MKTGRDWPVNRPWRASSRQPVRLDTRRSCVKRGTLRPRSQVPAASLPGVIRGWEAFVRPRAFEARPKRGLRDRIASRASGAWAGHPGLWRDQIRVGLGRATRLANRDPAHMHPSFVLRLPLNPSKGLINVSRRVVLQNLGPFLCKFALCRK